MDKVKLLLAPSRSGSIPTTSPLPSSADADPTSCKRSSVCTVGLVISLPGAFLPSKI